MMRAILLGIALMVSVESLVGQMVLPKPKLMPSPPTKPYAKVDKWQQVPIKTFPGKTIFNKPELPFGTIVNVPFFSPHLPTPQGAMQHWGWFCHKEWQMQQKLKLPLYVRLGSKEAVDRLEDKLSPR